MKMKRLALTLGAAFSAMLLGACSTAPAMPDKAWSIEPVMTVQHGGKNAAAYYALGRLEEHRPTDRALDAYRKAVEADPEFVPAWSALGSLHARLGQLDEALRALERAVGLAPAASHLHNNLGYAMLLAGQDEAAAAALRRAVQLDGSNRRAWRNLADAYWRLGEADNAQLAEARASGRWPGGTDPATPAAEPMPLGTGATVVPVSAPAQPEPQPAGGPAVHVEQSAPAFAVTQPSARTHLVKVAENVYELRATAAAPAPAAAQSAAPAPAAAPTAATAAAAKTNAPATDATAEPTRTVRYEVSNGHGRNGLARRVATQLHEDGLPFARLTNQLPFNEPTSVVQYRQGYRDAAEALVERLPFRPMLAVAPSEMPRTDVRLLLGHDLNRSAACADLALCQRPALAAAQPSARAAQ